MGLADISDGKLPSSDATEFEWNDCGHQFSKTVYPEETPDCPECGSFDLQGG